MSVIILNYIKTSQSLLSVILPKEHDRNGKNLIEMIKKTDHGLEEFMWLSEWVYGRPLNTFCTPIDKLSDNTERILAVLFNAYNESSGFDNATIKVNFEELYRLMNGKPLTEIEEIIYAVCPLCRDHEKAGFIEGIKVGMSLVQEIACQQ